MTGINVNNLAERNQQALVMSAVLGSRRWRFFPLALMLALSLGAIATAPVALGQIQITPAMIQQVQSMPKAQQAALARQYGIDPTPLMGADTAEPTPLAAPAEALEGQEAGSAEEQAQQAALDLPGKIKRYGEDLFNRKVSTFAVTDNAPVPSEYRLGTGDELLVNLYGKENEQHTLQIDRNGEINLPKLGPVALANLTFDDARSLIQSRVNNRMIGVEAIVSMGRLRAISIFMAGEVRVPGSYSVSALSTVTQALFVAGGVSAIGTLRFIEVKRAGQTIAVFDAYDLLMRGDVSQDVRLQSGDVVFVPPYTSLATIEGEVKRPMAYELKGRETAAQLVDMAGGYAQGAYPAAAVITRQGLDRGLPTVINVNLIAQAPATLVLNGDTLLIPKAAESYDNAVEIKGAAVRPGIYAWMEGLRVTDLLPSMQRDLLPTVDVEYALIVRGINERLDILAKQFNIGDALSYPGSDKDPLLQIGDQVILFNRVEAASRQDLLAPILSKLRSQARQGEPVNIVSVSGAVKSPGEYPLEQGDRVFDLIRAAGGLRDSAYLPSVEFRRVTAQSDGTVEPIYQELSLDNLADLTDANNLVLSSRDHLTIRDIPDWSPSQSVEIAGEVGFPGTYLIRQGETLTELIERAGGLKPNAFARGAVFTRESVAAQEADRAEEFATSIKNSFASSLLTQEIKSSDLADIESIANLLQGFKGKGRVLIDLEQALAGNAGANIGLLDGDRLEVPELNKTVTIVGEVRRQGTHTLQQGYDLDDYLGLSAGLTARADKDYMYIVRADGSVMVPTKSSWHRFDTAGQKLLAGDTIVVPINITYKDEISQWRDITQIIYQSAIAVAAVVAL